MNEQPHSLCRVPIPGLRHLLRPIALLLALAIAFTPVISVNAQSRYPQLRRDRRLTREVSIRYPATTNNRDGYIHRSGSVPTFQPGPSSSINSSDLSDESGLSNGTPNSLRPR